jgi:hypothetical protein
MVANNNRRGKEPSIAAPRIHQARLRDDGGVDKCREISEAEAVAERSAGGEVVVCGPEPDQNSAVAKRIELTANGSYIRHGKHHVQGLNHYQPAARPPKGHTFYETKSSKARKP